MEGRLTQPGSALAGTIGRVLVTGATGFVGSELCVTLAGLGLEVRAMVRRPLPAPASRITVVTAALEDEAAIRDAVDGIDAVVHLAGRVHLLRDHASDAAAAYRRVNVEGTRVLAERALDAGARTFVLASTVKVMGEGGPVRYTEAMTPAPADPYAESKLEAEALVRQLARQRGVHAPILRLPLVYGPRVKGNMLRLFAQVCRGLPLPLGAVRNQRSLLYLGNLCAAIPAVLEPSPATDRVFFLSDGHDLSTPELIRLIGAALGRPTRLVPVPPTLFRLAGRMGDAIDRLRPFPLTSEAVDRLVGSLTVDSTAFTTATGYRPPYSVEEGLKATAGWYLARRTTGEGV
jgi:nucleoside-diphosphate-sugar epimerase